MEMLRRKMDCFAIGLKNRADELLSREDGDTNFLSIIIVLVIVLGVAVVFIGFSNQITSAASTKIEELLNTLGLSA